MNNYKHYAYEGVFKNHEELICQLAGITERTVLSTIEIQVTGEELLKSVLALFMAQQVNGDREKLPKVLNTIRQMLREDIGFLHCFEIVKEEDVFTYFENNIARKYPLYNLAKVASSSLGHDLPRRIENCFEEYGIDNLMLVYNLFKYVMDRRKFNEFKLLDTYTVLNANSALFGTAKPTDRHKQLFDTTIELVNLGTVVHASYLKTCSLEDLHEVGFHFGRIVGNADIMKDLNYAKLIDIGTFTQLMDEVRSMHLRYPMDIEARKFYHDRDECYKKLKVAHHSAYHACLELLKEETGEDISKYINYFPIANN